MGKPRERRETGEQDLFRARLDQILNMKHEMVRLTQTIDWSVLEERFGAVYSDGPGMPPLPTRQMAGLAILKHTFDLSDEALCERWIENPVFPCALSRRCVCAGATVLKMGAGLPEPTCRGWLQTTPCCCAQEAGW